jgi:hypothetical protein
MDHEDRRTFPQACQMNARARSVNEAVFYLAPHAEAAPGSWVAICPTGASA